MSWQVNWRVWHWPWWHKHYMTDMWVLTGRDMYSNYAGIGPFQFHWYSS